MECCPKKYRHVVLYPQGLFMNHRLLTIKSVMYFEVSAVEPIDALLTVSIHMLCIWSSDYLRPLTLIPVVLFNFIFYPIAQISTQSATSMGVSHTMIAREFQRMKTIREIELNHNIIAFLDDVHASLNEKGATNPIGPFKRSLFHYMPQWEIAPNLFVFSFRMVQQ